MRINDYKPMLYQTNAEMSELYNSLDSEFENHEKLDVIQVFNNTFIALANEQGIEYFESLFNIVADPSEETLDFRRQRIINRLNSQLPYTFRYLEEKLNDILGVGNWQATLTYNTYHLLINMAVPGRGWYDELINMLDTILPCNIEYEVNVYAASWGQVNDHFATWNAVSSMTWQDVLDALWIND